MFCLSLGSLFPQWLQVGGSTQDPGTRGRGCPQDPSTRGRGFPQDPHTRECFSESSLRKGSNGEKKYVFLFCSKPQGRCGWKIFNLSPPWQWLARIAQFANFLSNFLRNFPAENLEYFLSYSLHISTFSLKNNYVPGVLAEPTLTLEVPDSSLLQLPIAYNNSTVYKCLYIINISTTNRSSYSAG